MKFRIDFVTNSSSSSYCVMTVTLKNKTVIDYVGEDGDTPAFETAKNAKKRLETVASVADLLAFLESCRTDPTNYLTDRFFDAVKAIPDLQDVSTVHLEFGEFYTEDGDYYGGSFSYDFETKAFKKKDEPDKDWLEEIFDMYGCPDE